MQIRSEVKQAIKQGISEDQIIQFVLEDLEKFPEHEFSWVHSNEFKYKGEYYDIVRKEKKGASLLLFCIHDVKESGLFAALDNIVAIKMGNHAPLQQQSSQITILLKSIFLPQNYVISFDWVGIKKADTFWLAKHTSSCYLPVFSPPD